MALSHQPPITGLKKAKVRRMRRVAGVYATATVRLHWISLATN